MLCARFHKDCGDWSAGTEPCKVFIRCLVVSSISSSHLVKRGEKEGPYATRSRRSLRPENLARCALHVCELLKCFRVRVVHTFPHIRNDVVQGCFLVQESWPF